MQRHYYILLWHARRPADASDSPAICRLRSLVPAIDALPVADKGHCWWVWIVQQQLSHFSHIVCWLVTLHSLSLLP